MPRLSMKLAVGIAVVLSIVVAGMVYAYLRDVASAKQKDLRSVVVAVQNVAPKTVLTRDMLKVEKVPVSYVQPGAIDKLEMAVNVMAKEQLLAGEQVVKHRLLIDMQGDGLAFQLPPGMRAYTVGVNETSGGAGFIRPGDRVDVLATYDKSITGEYTSHLVLQDISVLALNRSDVPVAGAGDKADAKKSSASSADNKLTSVTLAITPEEAAKMALAEDRGRIRLALRPFAAEAMPIMAARTVTPRDLVGYVYRAPQISSAPPVSNVNSYSMPSEYRMSAPVSAVSSGNTVQVVRGTTIENIAVK